MPELNGLDSAWAILDGIVDAIQSAQQEGDEEEADFLRAEALGAAKVIACWYGSRGVDWVRQEATGRKALRDKLAAEPSIE